MLRNDTSLTLHDTTKSRCVMDQVAAAPALARVLTQMTQIHPRVPYACAGVRTRMQNSSERRHVASCVMAGADVGGWARCRHRFGDGSFPAMNRSLRPREQPPIQTDFLSVVRSGSRRRPARHVGPCRARPRVARSYHRSVLSPHGPTTPNVGEAAVDYPPQGPIGPDSATTWRHTP